MRDEARVKDTSMTQKSTQIQALSAREQALKNFQKGNLLKPLDATILSLSVLDKHCMGLIARTYMEDGSISYKAIPGTDACALRTWFPQNWKYTSQAAILACITWLSQLCTIGAVSAQAAL